MLAALAVCLASDCLKACRASFVGLLAVATLLYIQATDSFLAARALPSFGGARVDRLRTMIAGCLMTAAFNCMPADVPRGRRRERLLQGGGRLLPRRRLLPARGRCR